MHSAKFSGSVPSLISFVLCRIQPDQPRFLNIILALLQLVHMPLPSSSCFSRVSQGAALGPRLSLCTPALSQGLAVQISSEILRFECASQCTKVLQMFIHFPVKLRVPGLILLQFGISYERGHSVSCLLRLPPSPLPGKFKSHSHREAVLGSDGQKCLMQSRCVEGTGKTITQCG